MDVNGPHHRCFELIVSSSFNQPMAVERGRSHELVASMVGAVYVHVLRTLIRLHDISAIARDNLVSAKEKLKKYHDRNISPQNFNVDEEVFLLAMLKFKLKINQK